MKPTDNSIRSRLLSVSRVLSDWASLARRHGSSTTVTSDILLRDLDPSDRLVAALREECLSHGVDPDTVILSPSSSTSVNDDGGLTLSFKFECSSSSDPNEGREGYIHRDRLARTLRLLGQAGDDIKKDIARRTDDFLSATEGGYAVVGLPSGDAMLFILISRLCRLVKDHLDRSDDGTVTSYVPVLPPVWTEFQFGDSGREGRWLDFDPDHFTEPLPHHTFPLSRIICRRSHGQEGDNVFPDITLADVTR